MLYAPLDMLSELGGRGANWVRAAYGSGSCFEYSKTAQASARRKVPTNRYIIEAVFVLLVLSSKFYIGDLALYVEGNHVVLNAQNYIGSHRVSDLPA